MALFSPRKAKHFLDYEKCSVFELRKFIEDRAGSSLSTRDHEGFQEAGRLKLAYRLRQMDRDSVFPHFLELPPEIRVAVYEYLLIDSRTGDAEVERRLEYWQAEEDEYQIHPAVLRTSRLIYSKAQPILYDKNYFHVKIGREYAETRSIGNSECHLKVYHPGHEFPFHHKASSNQYLQVMHRFSESSSADMLRVLDHPTVDLSLITEREPAGNYTNRARVAVAGLCLTLSSASKMKELVFKVELERNQSSRINLAEVLWPLIFLRKDLVVIFEGSSAALQPQLSGRDGTGEAQRQCPSSRAQGRFGRMIDQVRHRYNQELERKGTSESLDRIDTLLRKLDHLGEWIDMADIINSSAKWEALREQADGMQALMSLEGD